MSGIYGFVKIGNDDEKIAEGRVKGLRRWNSDYGRDGEGEVRGEGFAIGCFVEHFADAFPAGTPVFEDGDLLYAIDAVIYNRDELDAADGESDEEVIINLIKEKGYSELKNVNGDFAGAVLNRNTGELKLFRDHLGVRQLYYYLKDGLLAFSTDIRGLGALPDADLKIDERIIWLSMAGYSDSTLDRTHFEHMRCALPGSIMTFSEDGGSFIVSTERYFLPGQNRIKLENNDRYIARLRELTEDSIRRRLDAFPGRIGAELSGGLDSSVIDILINRMRRGGKYVAWRIVPDDWPLQPEDERIVIRDVAEQERLDLEYLPIVTELRIFENEAVPVFDNTWDIGETAKLVEGYGIKVVFSGQGGDEGVSRRCDVLELYRAHEYRFFFRELWYNAKRKKYRIPRFICNTFLQPLYFYPRSLLKPWRSDSVGIRILNREFVSKMKSIKGSSFFQGLDAVQEFLEGSIRLRPETAAYQAAEHGVRYIFPFEDYRLFDYALSIPRNLFRKGGEDRWIYRKAFNDIMPDSLRRVYYKDFPSIRNGEPPSSIGESEMIRRLVGMLDRDRWSEYLDFDSIERLLSSDDINNNEGKQMFSSIIERIWLFVLLQKFQDFCKIDGDILI